MTEDTEHIPTYKLGDTIRVELELTDDSGVGEVAARFNWPSDPTKKILLRGNGQGETTTRVVLQEQVTEDIAPGDYDCVWVSLRDVRENQRIINRPGIRLRIEGVPGDHEGPELKDWRVL